MKIERFEDINAWQKAKQLSLLIYKSFVISNDYGFKDHIQRASVNIMTNIAEGFERKNNNEFKQFLFAAKGSCGEIRSMLYLANDLDLIPKSNFVEIFTLCEELSHIITIIIKTL